MKSKLTHPTDMRPSIESNPAAPRQAQPVYCLATGRVTADLPAPDQALLDPPGLLAIGGDLAPERLIHAYRTGIFPWFSEGQPILWWSPDPRTVLRPAEVRVSRSLRRKLAAGAFRVSFDQAFPAVLRGCAAPRTGQDGTWLTPDMQGAYRLLARAGFAHSVEAWHGDELVGGLYGVAIGRVFFGESMFTRVSDASKVAFVTLVARLQAAGFSLIDCQVHTQHLESFGAKPLARRAFLAELAEQTLLMPVFDPWGDDADQLP